VQEVIVQNFRAKPGTRMVDAAEPTVDDHLWTIAAARILLPPDVHLQAPPNLTEDFAVLLDAGIDDWGGVSPVTIDHVNPEAPWPVLELLREATRSRGLELAPRLPVYPEWLGGAWLDPAVLPQALRLSDGLGLAREDDWAPGDPVEVPFVPRDALPLDTSDELGEEEIARLFRARGEERERVFAAADRLRREMCGDEVSYIVTRNIQYTNVCYFRCGFCAFSKGKLAANLRGPAFLVPHDEIARRVVEAWERGATEVCLQGGIHPAFDGDYYESVVRTIKAAVPEMHRACLFRAGDLAGGGDAGCAAARLPRAPARRRPLVAPGHGGRGARRRGACGDLPRQDQHGPVARGARRRACGRASLEQHDHVRTRRWSAELGEASRRGSRPAATERRLHRVRSPALRADGGADVPPGTRAARADVR